MTVDELIKRYNLDVPDFAPWEEECDPFTVFKGLWLGLISARLTADSLADKLADGGRSAVVSLTIKNAMIYLALNTSTFNSSRSNIETLDAVCDKSLDRYFLELLTTLLPLPNKRYQEIYSDEVPHPSIEINIPATEIFPSEYINITSIVDLYRLLQAIFSTQVKQAAFVI